MGRRKLKGKRRLTKVKHSYWDWLPLDIKHLIYFYAKSPSKKEFLDELKESTWDIRCELDYDSRARSTPGYVRTQVISFLVEIFSCFIFVPKKNVIIVTIYMVFLNGEW
jgi:hypothetical protein